MQTTVETMQVWSPTSQYRSPVRAMPAILAVLLNLGVVYGIGAGIGVIPKIKVSDRGQMIIVPAEKERPPIEQPPADKVPEPQADRQMPTLVPPEIPVEALPPETGAVVDVGRLVVDSRVAEPFSGEIVGPKLLRSTEPPYPEISRRREEQGVVYVRVTISPSGEVGDARIERSSGHQRLDEAALKAVRAWRFKPATRGDRAIVGEATVSVRFQLR
jgi:periplasmic protein TonB